MTSYDGVYTRDPKVVIAQLLSKQRFDEDQYYGVFDQLGVACDCNGNIGMQCLMMFGKAISFIKTGVKVEYSNVLNIEDCRDRCNKGFY